MPLLKDRQVSFAGGEFSPGLYGRTDIQKYHSGMKTAKNFFVTPQGTLMNRPGLRTILETLSGTTETDDTIRIFPFVFSDTDTALLIFTRYWLHIYKYDSTVGYVVNSAPGWSLGHPYTTVGDLVNLRIAQSGDVLTLVHPNYAPRELRRLNSTWASTSWELVTISTAIPPFVLRGGIPRFDLSRSKFSIGMYGEAELHTVASESEGFDWCVTRICRTKDNKYYETLPHKVVSAVGRTSTATQTMGRFGFEGKWKANKTYGNHFYSDVVHNYISIVYLEDDDTVWWYAEGDVGAGAKPGVSSAWSQIQGTAFDPDKIWGEDEATGLEQAPIEDWKVSAEYPIVIDFKNWPQWESVRGFLDSDDEVVSHRIYRGRDGRYGFVGETTDDFFKDEGAVPDFSFAPPVGTDPFTVWVDGVETTEYPSQVLYHEGRRFFAATANRPGWVAGSAVEDYSNFDEVIPARDNAFLNFDLASNKYERIRAMLGRQGLLLFTDCGEWLVAGGGPSSVLTPNNIAAKSLSKFGSGTLPPLELGDSIFFVQRRGTIPRLMVATGEGLRTIDTSTYSKHLFLGHTIKSWCWAEDPWNIIWAVRDDGVLLSCTYVPEQDLLAWSHHEIAAGRLAVCVCSLPEGNEDAVYVVVRHEGSAGYVYSLERMCSRLVSEIDDSKFLDFCTMHDGRNTDSEDTIYIEIVSGRTVKVHTSPVGDMNFTGKQVRMYMNEEKTLWIDTLCGAQVGSTGVWNGTLRDDMPSDWDYTTPTSNWAVVINNISTALPIHSYGPETPEVYAFLDGGCVELVSGDGPASNYVFPDGAYYAVVVVGARYDCDFESLAVAPERGKKKIVKTATIEMIGSRGGSAGVSLDNLEELPMRKVSDNYGTALRNEDVKVNIPSTWGEEGVVCFRQIDPLPIEIVGITREVEVGG